MHEIQSAPVKSAWQWTASMVALVALSNLHYWISMGAVEFMARTLIGGVVFGGLTFVVVWAVKANRAKEEKQAESSREV